MDEELIAAESGVTTDGFTPLAINDAIATAITRRLEEQEEVEVDAAPDAGAKSEPSALLATLEADEAAKVKQRSKKQWIKSREQIIEQESASAGLNEAAKRMATVTAGMMKAPVVPVLPPAAPLLPICLPLPLAATPALVSVPTSTEVQTSASTASPLIAASESAALVSLAPAASASGSAPTNTPMSSPPPPQSTDMPTAPTQSPPPAPLMPDNAAPFFTPPLGGFAPYLPITGAKIALPSTHSLVSVLYPVAASVYPPIQLSTTCPTCALQSRTAHECRLVLKHVAPPLLFDPVSVPGLGLIQWPPPPPPTLDTTPAVPSRQMIGALLLRCRRLAWRVILTSRSRPLCSSQISQAHVRGVPQVPLQRPPMPHRPPAHGAGMAASGVGPGGVAAAQDGGFSKKWRREAGIITRQRQERPKDLHCHMGSSYDFTAAYSLTTIQD
jgi:hypothetical protein